MKINILVPTLGTREVELKRLLTSLNNQSFRNFEIVIVSQDNHNKVDSILTEFKELVISHIQIEQKGISVARNKGLDHINDGIVVLSDDDAWYPDDSLEKINLAFESRPELEILTTQIFDPISDEYYKSYGLSETKYNQKYKLMSKSSIEIAFKYHDDYKFDEKFGIGSEFPAAEEVDFLLTNFIKGKIYYLPIITVYHAVKKAGQYHSNVSKGAVYRKHYPIVGFFIPLKDLFINRRNTFVEFYQGFFKY